MELPFRLRELELSPRPGRAATGVRWIVDGARAGAEQMAIDLTLAAAAAARGAITIRWYGWSPPCLSFGRNQPAVGRYEPDRLRALGIDVVRRPTGGGAVYHDDELTYAIALPLRRLGGARRTFTTVHQAIARALRSLGVAADTRSPCGPGRRASPEGACFAASADGEITVGGRKLVGSAQARIGRALLQHGSILIAGNQRIARGGRGSSAPPPTNLEECLGERPAPSELLSALAGAFDSLVAPLVPDALDEDEIRVAARTVSRFEDPAWTWRR